MNTREADGMASKSETVEFTTSRSVAELGRLLQDAMRNVKAQSVEPVQSDSGALAAFDDHADIEVVAHGRSSLLGGWWVVQVFVLDDGSERIVNVIALGDGGFARAMGGARSTVSIAASVKTANQIASHLR